MPRKADEPGLEAEKSVIRADDGDHDDSLLDSFWSSLLRPASKEAGLSQEARTGLSDLLAKDLDEQFTCNFESEVQELLALTEHELEDRLASEQRAFKRDQRRTRRKQQLLEDEEARLQAFRPARKANEQDEASEIAAKLHPLAKQFLSKKTGSRSIMSPRALQDLESSKRKLESLEEGLDAYDPEQDEFLNDLQKRLKPPRTKKPKT